MPEDGKEQEQPNKDEQPVKLEFKDYLALTIAALETFLLPLVMIGIVIAALAIFFALRP